MPDDWNEKLFFEACGGFCGTLDGRLCNFGLARGYASVTSNGGHDSASGFDGAWAANAPKLQNDFGWRSTHVVTLVAKARAAQEGQHLLALTAREQRTRWNDWYLKLLEAEGVLMTGRHGEASAAATRAWR